MINTLPQGARGGVVPGGAAEPGRLVPDPPSPAGPERHGGAVRRAVPRRRLRPRALAKIHELEQQTLVEAALHATDHEDSASSATTQRLEGCHRSKTAPPIERPEKLLMSTEIRVPPLPESIADATLVAWHKQPGDAISRDENLADLETDKVVLEVPAPANGVVGEIKLQWVRPVTSGQVLAQIEAGAAPGRREPAGRRRSARRRRPRRRRRPSSRAGRWQRKARPPAPRASPGRGEPARSCHHSRHRDATDA